MPRIDRGRAEAPQPHRCLRRCSGDPFKEAEVAVLAVYLEGGGKSGKMACIVSSGMRLPVGEVDFRWGRPAFVSYHFPWPGSTGYVMPMPSAHGDGDWVVYVHAAPEVVEVMEAEPTVFGALESSYVFG